MARPVPPGRRTRTNPFLKKHGSADVALPQLKVLEATPSKMPVVCVNNNTVNDEDIPPTNENDCKNGISGTESTKNSGAMASPGSVREMEISNQNPLPSDSPRATCFPQHQELVQNFVPCANQEKALAESTPPQRDVKKPVHPPPQVDALQQSTQQHESDGVSNSESPVVSEPPQPASCQPPTLSTCADHLPISSQVPPPEIEVSPHVQLSQYQQRVETIESTQPQEAAELTAACDEFTPLTLLLPIESVPSIPEEIECVFDEEANELQKLLLRVVRKLLGKNKMRLEDFKINARLFGNDFMEVHEYLEYLVGEFGPVRALQLVPCLLRIQPDPLKRELLLLAARNYLARHRRRIEQLVEEQKAPATIKETAPVALSSMVAQSPMAAAEVAQVEVSGVEPTDERATKKNANSESHPSTDSQETLHASSASAPCVDQSVSAYHLTTQFHAVAAVSSGLSTLPSEQKVDAETVAQMPTQTLDNALHPSTPFDLVRCQAETNPNGSSELQRATGHGTSIQLSSDPEVALKEEEAEAEAEEEADVVALGNVTQTQPAAPLSEHSTTRKNAFCQKTQVAPDPQAVARAGPLFTQSVMETPIGASLDGATCIVDAVGSSPTIHEELAESLVEEPLAVRLGAPSPSWLGEQPAVSDQAKTNPKVVSQAPQALPSLEEPVARAEDEDEEMPPTQVAGQDEPVMSLFGGSFGEASSSTDDSVTTSNHDAGSESLFGETIMAKKPSTDGSDSPKPAAPRDRTNQSLFGEDLGSTHEATLQRLDEDPLDSLFGESTIPMHSSSSQSATAGPTASNPIATPATPGVAISRPPPISSMLFGAASYSSDSASDSDFSD